MVILGLVRHLGHANIAGANTSTWKEGYRDFDSVKEMDNTIISNMNRLIAHDDTLWYLGDFVFGGHTKIPDYRSRINCQNIHFIKGNHDKHIDKYKNLFLSVQTEYEGSIDRIPLYLHHFAHRVWIGSHKGFLHGYGHSHGSIADWGRSSDLGIDAIYQKTGQYNPVELHEWAHEMNKRDIEFPDHHAAHTNVR